MPRAIHAITGSDAEHFLQGLITTDIAGLDKGLLYAALLTPQGKYIADFFLLRHGGSVLVDVDAEIAPTLIQRLNMYKLRSDVRISESDVQVFRGTGPAPDGALADPRHPAMGWRLYGTRSGDDGTDWEAIRVAHCIPETGIELTPESFVLEAGLDRLGGVDFRKGCYVGQEVTARMRHKTKLRKGLCTVSIDGDAAPGTPITSSDEKQAGTLCTRSGDRAIAYLRFDRAGPNMHAGYATVHYTRPE